MLFSIQYDTTIITNDWNNSVMVDRVFCPVSYKVHDIAVLMVKLYKFILRIEERFKMSFQINDGLPKGNWLPVTLELEKTHFSTPVENAYLLGWGTTVPFRVN